MELNSTASDTETDREDYGGRTPTADSIVAPHKQEQVRRLFTEIKRQQKALQGMISKLDDVLEGYEEPEDLSDADALHGGNS